MIATNTKEGYTQLRQAEERIAGGAPEGCFNCATFRSHTWDLVYRLADGQLTEETARTQAAEHLAAACCKSVVEAEAPAQAAALVG